ncbi:MULTISPECIES: pyridoxamine 5'-phosphate oxidase family protein [unclassified Crossiella]|uniref:pyridoxamine 5'-phosphate oxidase family protein n=1 Tax=unclassified Crossiella TaxID=2620835 RepID=UPI001FFF830F|nr:MULTISPECIES: pyridoxamine 5'-phosphate oxidase family protein [unclassified Crossiella]MCK2243992.1 pyridoxamine 5'-phosphate oxidase family protein [Crossiella sp. S99.2]MCK2257150.1 pyridoxamine 5'-phosphate oxidase family protein [Crossiella sp. S99.1]
MGQEFTEATDRAISILRENRYVTLATVDAAGPWAAALAFAPAAPGYLYFASQNDSRHGLAIAGDARVAGVIYNSTITSDEADGVQFSGTATAIEDDDQQILLFLKRTGDLLIDPLEEEFAFFKQAEGLTLYRITVEAAYVLDQKRYLEEAVDAREEVNVSRLFAETEARYAE